MDNWHPQHYHKQGKDLGIDKDILSNALGVAAQVTNIDPALPPVFTLNHLAHLSNFDYGILRNIASRNIENPYKVFRLKKNSGRGYRVISIPAPDLMQVQRWINKNILSFGHPNLVSYAFMKGVNIKDAAALHCG